MNMIDYGESKKCEYLCNFLSYSRVKIPYETIEKLITIKFEDGSFFAPDNCDEWLKAFYGNDYLSLPQEDKRVSKHIYKAYFLDKYE